MLNQIRMRNLNNQTAIHDLRGGKTLLALATLCLAITSSPAEEQPKSEAAPAAKPAEASTAKADSLKPFMAQHCFMCHGNEKAKAKLNFESILGKSSPFGDAAIWRETLDRVGHHEMPPEDEPQPESEARQSFLQTIEEGLREAAQQLAGDPGPAPLRRLNRTEYRYTLRELLGIHVDVSHLLPVDGAGGEGYDNAAETLFISPLHAEMYLEAANEALSYAFRDSNSRRLIFNKIPAEPKVESTAAETILRNFISRAFRRPAKDEEVKRYQALFDTARKEGDSFVDSIFYAAKGVMISPNFLFRVEEPNLTSEPHRVTEFELATRLSYFLQATMPDNDLTRLAREGKLSDPNVLRQQVERLAKNRDSFFFAENFIGQWLGTRELGKEFKPDQETFKGYNEELESVMRSEPAYFFAALIRENHSLLNLVDSKFTYLNNDLARHYKLKTDGQKVQGSLNKFDLPEDSRRGGVLTMAATLAVSSYPHRTSPVLRGKWVMEKILGTPPPPPPPNVPELDEEKGGKEAKTLRERLAQHRADPTCASCHDRIDPVGFGLENFDAIGRWRDQEGGKPIDSAGKLPGGLEFKSVDELKQVLTANPDKFIRHFTTQMLAYALGRGIVESDHPVIDGIVERLKQNDYKAHELLLGIVESRPFQYKRPQQRPTNDGEAAKKDS